MLALLVCAAEWAQTEGHDMYRVCPAMNLITQYGPRGLVLMARVRVRVILYCRIWGPLSTSSWVRGVLSLGTRVDNV